MCDYYSCAPPVVPNAAESFVSTSISPNSVAVQWEMHYKMESFTGTPKQELSWRFTSDNEWNTVSTDAKYD